MNLLDFSYKSGWPGSASTFEFIQGQILLLQQLSLVHGSTYVISGCIVTGSNVSDGVVVVNGEILPFIGGAIQTNVVVVEAVQSKQYFDLQIRPYYKNRHATFGTAGTVYPWANFDRSTPTNGILKRMKAVEEVLATLGSDLDALETAFGSHTHTWASITDKPNGYTRYVGSVTLGDIGAGGGYVAPQQSRYTISIPNQTDNNYKVIGTLKSLTTDLNNDNYITWVVGGFAADSFQLAVREGDPVLQNLVFDFIIVK